MKKERPNNSQPENERCFANRHMTFTEFAIYQLCSMLANKTGTLTFGTRALAEQFTEGSKETVRRTLKRLAATGWIEEIAPKRYIGTDRSSPTYYKVIPHDEWAKHHAGCRGWLRGSTLGGTPESHIATPEGHDSTQGGGTPESHIAPSESHIAPPESHIATPEGQVFKISKVFKVSKKLLPPDGGIPVAAPTVELSQHPETQEPKDKVLTSRAAQVIAINSLGRSSPPIPPAWLVELVRARTPLQQTYEVKTKNGTKSIDPACLAIVTNAIPDTVAMLMDWAMAHEFWGRIVSGRNLLMNFANNYPTIQQQYAARPKQKDKKPPLKAENVKPGNFKYTK